jgi:hypothetical protein
MKKVIMILLLLQATNLSCAETSNKYSEYYAVVKKISKIQTASLLEIKF